MSTKTNRSNKSDKFRPKTNQIQNTQLEKTVIQQNKKKNESDP